MPLIDTPIIDTPMLRDRYREIRKEACVAMGCQPHGFDSAVLVYMAQTATPAVPEGFVQAAEAVLNEALAKNDILFSHTQEFIQN